MKLLITGKGHSGSWAIRGVQMGGQVGKVVPRASLQEMMKSDIIVAVKRLTPDFLANIRRSGKPWIWDIVDFYPQPLCSGWSRAQAISWVQDQLAFAKPDGVIFPNRRMRDEIVYNGVTIYHHARPNAEINPIRKDIKIIGYEGSEKFIAQWREIIVRQCSLRGWQFRVGMPLNEADIVLAVRDDVHAGYAQRRWKSNVKLANAHATGTPFIGMVESSYLETSSGMEHFVSDEEGLSSAFYALRDQEARVRVQTEFLRNVISLDQVSQQLRGYAEKVLNSK